MNSGTSFDPIALPLTEPADTLLVFGVFRKNPGQNTLFPFCSYDMERGLEQGYEKPAPCLVHENLSHVP